MFVLFACMLTCFCLCVASDISDWAQPEFNPAIGIKPMICNESCVISNTDEMNNAQGTFAQNSTLRICKTDRNHGALINYFHLSPSKLAGCITVNYL